MPPTAPPERVHICLDSKAPWVQVRRTKSDVHYPRFSEESLEDWHRRHRLLSKDR